MKFILILGIDTAAKISCVALAYADLDNPKSDISISTLAEIYSGGNISHSENLCPMVDYVLRTAGVSLAEINLFAVSEGPGSFTGIRIGVSTVKGLAYGSDCNCIGISSLKALAYNLRGYDISDGEKLFVAPVIDARRKQVYNAAFNLSDGGGIDCIKKDRLITIEEFQEELNSDERFAEGEIIFIGDGADMCYEEIKLEKMIKKHVGDILSHPNGSSVCAAAAAEIIGGVKPIHPKMLSPSYLIKTQAEREMG